MSPVLRIVSGAFLVLVLVFLLYLIRRRSVNAKYSLLWAVVCLVLISFDIFPDLLMWASHLFGFYSSSNFFLTGIIFLLVCVSIHFSVVLTRNENRIRSLIERVALTENRISKLEESDLNDS
ncbi:MAG: DUF2304 domain-containing protein [Bifidobacteriaceae bacterium]|jgi:hypothetical protein|nr:DUF2304 domain-containing protein [Bifidobacteriaceae bacterium]